MNDTLLKAISDQMGNLEQQIETILREQLKKHGVTTDKEIAKRVERRVFQAEPGACEYWLDKDIFLLKTFAMKTKTAVSKQNRSSKITHEIPYTLIQPK